MTIEQILIEKWRAMSPPRQQEVIDFVEFFESKLTVVKTNNQPQLRPLYLRSLAKNPSRDIAILNEMRNFYYLYAKRYPLGLPTTCTGERRREANPLGRSPLLPKNQSM